MTKSLTGDSLKSEAGIHTIITIRNSKHTGVTKRSTETRADHDLDKVSSKDIGKSGKKEAPFANPNFGAGPEGGSQRG